MEFLFLHDVEQGDGPDNNGKEQLIYPGTVSDFPDCIFCVNGLQLVDQMSTCRGLVQHTTADTDSKASSATIPTIYVDSSCGLSILNTQK
jgi:hypothetical protein